MRLPGPRGLRQAGPAALLAGRILRGLGSRFRPPEPGLVGLDPFDDHFLDEGDKRGLRKLLGTSPGHLGFMGLPQMLREARWESPAELDP